MEANVSIHSGGSVAAGTEQKRYIVAWLPLSHLLFA